jgi:hypothetical protein
MAVRRKPAETPDERENKMIALAVELAETQLRNGTASAQVISHYIKLGSSRERLEQLRLEQDILKMKAQQDALAAAGRIEEMYTKALDAMRTYQGNPPDPRSDHDYPGMNDYDD